MKKIYYYENNLKELRVLVEIEDEKINDDNT